MSLLFKINISTIIQKGETFFIQKRSPQEDIYPNLWGIPGGTVEMNDGSLENALRREVKEEVGLDIDNIRIIQNNIKKKELYGVLYIVCIAAYVGGTISTNEEVADTAWITKDQLDDYIWTPTTKELLWEIYGT